MTSLTMLRHGRKPLRMPAETRSADIDWITLTAKTNGLSDGLWRVGERFLCDNERVGYVPTRWQANGYRGWCSEGVRLGARSEGCIVSLSGLKCGENWHEAFTTAEHCSRLDLAVDVYLDPEMPTLTRDCYESLLHVPPGNGRPAKRTLIVNSDGGSTLYIGSRTSDRFARLYDKGIEQKTHPAGKWWRLELEIKGNSSHPAAEQLAAAEIHNAVCLATVADYFQQRAGVIIPHADTLAVRYCQRAPTTIERRLLWLSHQVRGTVLELTREVGRRRVLDALGILQSAVEES